MTSNGRSDAPEGLAPTRSIRRRPPLPNGRAVVGALLVTVSALTVFTMARVDDGGPDGAAVVTTRDLPAGHHLVHDDLRVVAVDLPETIAAASFATVPSLVGAVTVAPLGVGELVQSGAVVPAEHALDGAVTAAHELTLPVDTAHAPARLTPGEHVALLATTGSGASAVTAVTVADAVVVAYRTDTGSLAANPAVLTVALTDPAQVLAATRAAHAAELTVVRTTAGGNFPDGLRGDDSGVTTVLDLTADPPGGDTAATTEGAG